MLSLVFPREMISEPNIGESLPSRSTADWLFERISLADGIRSSWMRLTKHLAQIEKMRLCPAAL